MNPSRARDAWFRWQDAAGPWRGYGMCPLLLSPELRFITPRRARGVGQRAESLAAELGAALERGGTLAVLDLEPTLGVHVAAHLYRARRAHPVLVLPRWPYAEAVLPVESVLYALLAESRALPGDVPRLDGVVFVLDGKRTRLVPDRRPDDERADNRHMLSIFDLPNLATLRARGISRILKVA